MLKFYITYIKQGIMFGVLCEGTFFHLLLHIFEYTHI
jgi:hypothetical protein